MKTTDPRTRCAQGEPAASRTGRPLAPTIVPASTFEFASQADVDRYYDSGEGHVYSRYGNPTVDRAAALLAALEGAERTALFSSGMAAIHTALSVCVPPGGLLVAQAEIYGGSASLIRDAFATTRRVRLLGLERINGLEPDDLEGASALYLETPINPTLKLVDLVRAAGVARAAGVTTMVDATFATPMFLRPVEHGIDLTIHSATKYLGGHCDLLGGAVSGSRERIDAIEKTRRVLGGTMDPFTAFLLHRGMRTLAVRMEAHQRGARKVAEWLVADRRVTSVFYSGLADHPQRAIRQTQMDGDGGMLSFTVRGGEAAAVRVHDRLGLFARAGSLGGVNSLVSLPARMSHRYLAAADRAAIGVTDDMIRLSIGLEAPDDLIADLDQAMAAL